MSDYCWLATGRTYDHKNIASFPLFQYGIFHIYDIIHCRGEMKLKPTFVGKMVETDNSLLLQWLSGNYWQADSINVRCGCKPVSDSDKRMINWNVLFSV